jgi:hypothetical protein
MRCLEDKAKDLGGLLLHFMLQSEDSDMRFSRPSVQCNDDVSMETLTPHAPKSEPLSARTAPPTPHRITNKSSLSINIKKTSKRIDIFIIRTTISPLSVFTVISIPPKLKQEVLG